MNYKDAVLKAPAAPTAPLAATRAHVSAQQPQRQTAKANPGKLTGKFIAAIINSCFGGIGLSDFAMDLYCLRYENKFNKKFEGSDFCISRSDPLLIDLLEEFPNQVSAGYAKLEVVYYSRKYDGFFRISEYDGKERGSIDIPAYMLSNTKRILTSTLSADKKVQQIDEVINGSYADAKVYPTLPTDSDSQTDSQK